MESVSIKLTRSRVAKGLIGIPRTAAHLFPSEPCRIQVVFDDETEPRTNEYIPYEPKAKERRIFGVGHWFTVRGVQPGDIVHITLEDPERHLYRIASDRYLREIAERRIRQQAHSVKDVDQAFQLIGSLASAKRARPAALAALEIRELLQRSASAGPRISRTVSGVHRAPAGPWIHALLGQAYSGKCQLCSSTFLKADGMPYFEI